MSFLDIEAKKTGTKTKKSLVKGYKKITKEMLDNPPNKYVWVFTFAKYYYFAAVLKGDKRIHICKSFGKITSPRDLFIDYKIPAICDQIEDSPSEFDDNSVWCEDCLKILEDFALHKNL